MKTEELLKNRMKELADKAYRQSVYCHTPFLNPAEQSLYYSIRKELSYISSRLDGGYEDAERRMLIFGSEEEFGYREDSPIVCLKVEPLSVRFSEKLNHRDYLGAVLNLGIERECIGDILVEDAAAYLFCIESMAEYLCEQITKIRHTSVRASRVDMTGFSVRPKVKPVEGFLSSIRLDAVVSLGFGMSRKESMSFIKNKRVFINGRMIESGSRPVSEGDLISVRGKGKIKFSEVRGQSKKGRISVLLHRYIG